MVVREVVPISGPCANRPANRLYLPVESRFHIEDPERRVLILRLGDDVAARGVRRKRVAAAHARGARNRGQELGLVRAGNVIDVVASRTRAIEHIPVSGGIVTDVEVVVAPQPGLRRLWYRHLGDEAKLRITREELL